ncbi:C-type lectin domain family 4 member E isoform X2 [Etheostoma spectabile]|uniref:C-type lectin domain family 4 member E isoform X2 n=1 Tax=Etheostoma spectabile TaxID=54343 RepID=UPI0013AF4A1D|nr:C-type lectin domain family 4 member E-like isoform X2 [Etheostoma spectabile]
MQQMEVSDYVDELPRPKQKGSGDAKQTERRLCQVVLLSFGLLCVIQAILNVSLRLTYSTHSECNTTHLPCRDQVKKGQQDCEIAPPGHCNRLQDQVNALMRDRTLLETTNTELNNKIKDLEEERDRLRTKLGTNVSGPVGCSAGWREINSRCYFLSTEQKTWEESRKYCQSKEADLVVINSEQEQRALYRLDGDEELSFWIGLNTTETTGWKWVDGSALTTTFWQAGQPDDGGPNNVEDCVEMYHKKPELTSWNDAPCGAQRRWLCEKNQAGKIIP